MIENDKNALLRGVTVLVTDDDPLMAELYEKRVELSGGQAIVAANGEEALAKLKRVKIDAILLDIKMPKMNGYEVLRHLRNDPALKDIPVFVLTSLESHPEYVEKATDIKVEEFLLKSNVSPEAVMEKVAAALQRKAAEPAA